MHFALLAALAFLGGCQAAQPPASQQDAAETFGNSAEAAHDVFRAGTLVGSHPDVVRSHLGHPHDALSQVVESVHGYAPDTFVWLGYAGAEFSFRV